MSTPACELILVIVELVVLKRQWSLKLPTSSSEPDSLTTGCLSFVGNLQVWITNEHLHDGLRVAGDAILPRLFDLAAGKARVTGR